MKEFKGSKTEQNLKEAFAGESMARNKYAYYASKAKKDGYEQIAAIFTETENNEKEHAKMWFKEFSSINDTYENLLSAAAGEYGEWTEMYKHMAETAREEGFEDLAIKFDNVAKIEEAHEKRFKKLAENIKNGEVFQKKEKTFWICRNCGYIHNSESAPTKCPVCNHPQSYFEVKAINY